MAEGKFGWVEPGRAVIPGPLPQGPVEGGGWFDDWPWEEGFEDDALDFFSNLGDLPGVRHLRSAGEDAWVRPIFTIDHDTSIGPSLGEIASSPLRLVAWGFDLDESLPGYGKVAQFDKYADVTHTAADIVERPEFGGAVVVTIGTIMTGKALTGGLGKLGKGVDKVRDMRRSPEQKARNARIKAGKQRVNEIANEAKRMYKIGFPPNKAVEALKFSIKFTLTTGPAWASGWLGHINDQVRIAKGLEPKFGGDGSLPETDHETLDAHLQRIVAKDGLQGLENVKREIEGLQDALEQHPANQPPDVSDEVVEEVEKQIKDAGESMAVWIREKVLAGRYIKFTTIH